MNEEVKYNWLDRWFIYWHGIGGKDQYPVFRCQGCRRLITHNTIKQGMCGCGVNRVSPTNPTWWEQFKLFVLPFLVTHGR